jgi:ABC-type sugar transport system permease subunit
MDSRVNFVATAPRAIGTTVLAAVWKATPFTALILLAGLQTVPLELYDAAKVDGCGIWGRFRNVTLPYLRPPLMIALVLGTQGGILVFDIVYIMTGGGPGGATEMIAYFIYLQGFEALRMGYATALSFMLGIVITVIAAIYFKLLYTEELL